MITLSLRALQRHGVGFAELADALGIDYTRANKGALSRAIRRRLMGTRGLVIVDEADHLVLTVWSNPGNSGRHGDRDGAYW